MCLEHIEHMTKEAKLIGLNQNCLISNKGTYVAPTALKFAVSILTDENSAQFFTLYATKHATLDKIIEYD